MPESWHRDYCGVALPAKHTAASRVSHATIAGDASEKVGKRKSDEVNAHTCQFDGTLFSMAALRWGL